VAAGIFDETMLDLRHCAGLPLSREPFCCAVSIYHRLAAKDKLKIKDLYGENLMLMLMCHKVTQIKNRRQPNYSEYMCANKYLHLCFDQFTYTCKMLKF
jgi:hypothetical protein